MIEFIEVMFRALTGLKLTFPNIISLAVFFAAGYYFAATVKRVGPIKMIFVLLLAYLLSTLLSGLLGVYTLAVVLGFLSNQGVFLARVLLWVESFTEFLFVMRHRAVYEDIRREEPRDVPHEARASSQTRSSSKASAAGGSAGGAAHSGPRLGRDDWKPGPGKSQADIDRCLSILGLEVGRSYSKQEIKKAYRRLAMIYHPDLPKGNHEAFVRLGMASDYLMQYAAA